MDDDEVHVIDLRMKCVLVVLRYLLVLLLRHSSLRHKDCKTKTSLEIGMAEIFAANERQLKKKKSFFTEWTIENFYDKVVGVGAGGAVGAGGTATFTLKAAFVLDELDFAVMCDLLLAADFSTLAVDKCCSDCSHFCLECGTAKCKKSSACRFKPCSNSMCNTSSQDCQYMNYAVFIVIAKALRNTNAHVTFATYDKFENHLLSLRLFPNCSSWEDIWNTINKVTLCSFNLMVVHGLLNRETYKDKEMELRIALRKEKNCLIPIVGGFIKDFYRNIVSKQEMSDELQMVHRKLDLILEGKSCSGRCLDSVWYENKMISFDDDDKNEAIALELKTIASERITFTCKVTEDFKLLCLQSKNVGKGWFYLPKEMYIIRQDAGDFQLDVLELNPLKSYSFRLLGIDVGSGKQYVLSYKKLKPIESKYFVEVHGMKISIVKEESLVVQQKIENGLIFESATRLAKEDIIAIQYSLDKQTWRDIKEENYNVKSNQIEINFGGMKMKCSIRLVVKKVDDNVLYKISDVLVVGKMDLRHLSVSRTSEKTVLAFFHAFGYAEDMHQLIHMDHAVNVTKITRCHEGGGSVSEDLAKADDYLKNNFSGDAVILFRGRQHQQQQHSHESFNLILKTFCSYYKHHCVNLNIQHVLITGYDMLHHFQSVTTPVNLADFDISLTENLNSDLIIFNDEMNAVINVYICEGSTTQDLCQAYKNCHDQLKALVIVFNDLISKGLFVFTGIVVTRKMSRQQVEELHFCKTDSSVCNLFTLALTDDDLENPDAFFERLTEITSEIHGRLERYRPDHLDSKKEMFYQLPNRLMVMSSLESIEHPSAFGSAHEKIITLVLNKEQRNAIYNPSKRKIIQGPYGSGKTIVIQKILQNLVKKTESDEHVFYYINCDEYSLLHCEIKKYCQQLEGKYKTNIVCMSIDEISAEKGSSSILSLSESLNYLATKHKDQNVNIFADELDSENLTAPEAEFLNRVLTLKKCYSNSTVVMNVQSISKHRQSILADRFSKQMYPAVVALQMDAFSLPKAMRYTRNIHRIMEVIQTLISKQKNIYYELEKAGSAQQSLPFFYASTSSKEIVQVNVQEHIETTSDEMVPLDESPGIDCVDGGLKSLQPPQVSIKIDTLAKLSTANDLASDEILNAIKTDFIFPKNEGCGHHIDGTKPALVRLHGEVFKFKPTSTVLSINTLATVFSEFFKPRWSNTMVISSTLRIAELAYHALKALKLHVVVYVNALKLEYPTNGLKDSVFSEWVGKKNCVLLTDYRGCRGLQHDKVALLLDEEESYEHFLLPEIIGRSTSNLTLFSFKGDKETITKPVKGITVGKILNELVSKDLVKPQRYDHLQVGEFLKEPECCCSELFSHSITESNAGVLYHQLFSSEMTKAKNQRTNDLYNRACELGKYMEAKYLGTAQVSDDIGDQLYDQCTQLISQSEEAFQRITSKLSGYTMSSKDYDAIFDLVLNECTFGKILSVFSYGLYLSRIKFMNGLPIMNMAAHAISSQSEWIWDQGGLDALIVAGGRTHENEEEASFVNWKAIGEAIFHLV